MVSRILEVKAPTVVVSQDGPLVVEGDAVTIRDHLGLAIEASETPLLCRCGGSSTKPFCDGTHQARSFSGEKSEDRVDDMLDRHVGVSVTIGDNRGTCAHSGLCTDRLNAVFHADSEPFATPNGARADDIVAAVRRCPSGALSLSFGADVNSQTSDSQRDPEIVVSKDGPYFVRGGIQIVDGLGDPVERNAGSSLEHSALCRCGNSKNKPFCSGAHWATSFSDPTDPERPTIFEWAGGYPALVDVLTIFYGKYIPEDDLLRPVFLEMSPDHPERVGAWLGEVFGGPARYSESMGGYSAMISHHLGRALDEPKRKRWVALFIQAMDEVGLSNNAEFRSAVIGYLEWGTRIAVENSQHGAQPPPNMPMPRWTWDTSPGNPNSRTSALAEPEAEREPTLPGDDEIPSFATHVSTLFRHRDVASMKWAFDLSDYDDVVKHSVKISERVADGSMPPDHPWPDHYVDVFQRWVNGDFRR